MPVAMYCVSEAAVPSAFVILMNSPFSMLSRKSATVYFFLKPAAMVRLSLLITKLEEIIWKF